MAKTHTLSYKRIIKAPSSDVYRYFTNSSLLREWFSDTAHTQPRKGGRVYLAWNDGYYMSSTFGALVENKKINYTWTAPNEPPSKVLITLKERDGSTVVSVSHSGLPTDRKSAKLVKGIDSGWKSALENLQSVIETGEDMRFTMRPMLGITGFEEMNKEIAARLGVSVTEGIRIGGTVEGMSAAKAGLKGDDVVVSIGGKKADTFPSLTNALQQHRAGDEVKVVIHRGKEKMTLPMKLSKRPLPDIPWTANDFAAGVKKLFDSFDVELEKSLNGVTDEQASYRSTENEWSIKDVLAHLIISERDNQGFLTESIQSAQRSYDNFPSNSEIRHKAIFAAHPTLKELLAEWKRAQREILAMCEVLPAEFIARKGSYWLYAYGTLQGNIHMNDHLRQIQKSLEQVKNKK